MALSKRNAKEEEFELTLKKNSDLKSSFEELQSKVDQRETQNMRLIGPDGKEMSRDDVRHFCLQLNEKIKVAERLKTQLRSESLILQRTEQISTANFNPKFEPIIQPPPLPPTFEPAHSPTFKLSTSLTFKP